MPLVAPSHATGGRYRRSIAAIFRKAIGGTVHEMIPYTNTAKFLTTVVPSSNTVSTADEMSRFAEIWRRGGELDGVRVIAPETMYGAVQESRRLRPDFAVGLMPARWGTGFKLGTRRFGPFGRNAPAAFGNLGLVQHRDLGRSRPRDFRRIDQQRQARPGSRSRSSHRADGHHRRRDPDQVAVGYRCTRSIPNYRGPDGTGHRDRIPAFAATSGLRTFLGFWAPSTFLSEL